MKEIEMAWLRGSEPVSKIPVPDEPGGVEGATSRPRMTLNVFVSQRQKEIYGVVASAYGLSLEDWVLQVLEQAAKEAVPQVEAAPGSGRLAQAGVTVGV
jgi:hypothetical protein